MERLVLTLPALYGDHHVAAIRRALDGVPGVRDVHVSPAGHTVRLVFDPAKQTAQTIEDTLAAAGYSAGDPERAFPGAGPAAPRHTAVLGDTLSFRHEPPAWEGRPLWPCPGFDRTPTLEN